MDITAPVKCLCGRTVPSLSQHRPGASHPQLQSLLRIDRKGQWCPDTDTRKKEAEEAAAKAKIDAEQAPVAELPASTTPDAPAVEAQPG